MGMKKHNFPPGQDILVVTGNQLGKTTGSFYNKSGSYEGLLEAVRKNMTYEWCLCYACPIGTPDYIIKELYDKAVQEVWEEAKLLKTNVGKLLYV